MVFNDGFHFYHTTLTIFWSSYFCWTSCVIRGKSSLARFRKNLPIFVDAFVLNRRLMILLRHFLHYIVTVVIVVNNFFVIGIMQHLKILETVFKPKKIIKTNYKPSKMKVSKDTFQHSFNFHNDWLKKAYMQIYKHTRTNAHISAC